MHGGQVNTTHRWPWLRLLAVVLIGLPVGIALAVVWLLAGSGMDYDGRLLLAGLERPVTVHFDRHARPYVQAESLDDALYTQGWLHARERLWQMDLLRRAGRARLSALLGRDTLETDRSLWRAGVPDLAGQLLAGSSPASRKLVEAYTRGVNAGLGGMRRAPPEYQLLGVRPEPWAELDSYAVAAIMAFDSANNLDLEMLRQALRAYLPEAWLAVFLPLAESDPEFPYLWPPKAPPVSVDPAQSIGRLTGLQAIEALSPAARPAGGSVRFGSNGWVVSGRRSASGHALFAFDSHDRLGLPNLFYEVHLFFGQGRQLRGWSVPGLPAVINGFNEFRAWGLTNIGDTQDLVLVRPDPARADWFDDGRGGYPARRESDRIPVRGGEPVRVERLMTPNGPLISEDPPLALRWTGHDLAGAGLDALLALNLAIDPARFEQALRDFPAPVANITWADRDGRIGFRTIGQLPVRRLGNGLAPVADDGADIWSGRVPGSAMPSEADPEQGFLAAANARVHDPDWTYLVSNDNAPGWRMRRIVDVLAGGRDLTMDDMAGLQNDWFNGQAARDLPRLLGLLDPALSAEESDPRVGKVRDLLLDWLAAPFNAPDQVGPVVFESWYLAVVKRVLAARIPARLIDAMLDHNYLINQAMDRLLADLDSPWWQGDAAHLVHLALIDAIDELSARAGPEPGSWTLASRQSLTLNHELGKALGLLAPLVNRGPYVIGGGHATVGRAGFRYRRAFQVDRAATLRVVLSMGPEFSGRAVMPGGQSGRFYSPHYADQLPLWLNAAYLELAATPGQVRGRRLRIEPR